MPIRTTNPFNNRIIREFKETSEEALEDAVSASSFTFSKWKKTEYARRSQLLYNVAGILRTKKKELSRLITMEMGKL